MKTLLAMTHQAMGEVDGEHAEHQDCEHAGSPRVQLGSSLRISDHIIQERVTASCYHPAHVFFPNPAENEKTTEIPFDQKK